MAATVAMYRTRRTGARPSPRDSLTGVEQGLPVPTDRPRPKPIWMQSPWASTRSLDPGQAILQRHPAMALPSHSEGREVHWSTC